MLCITRTQLHRIKLIQRATYQQLQSTPESLDLLIRKLENKMGEQTSRHQKQAKHGIEKRKHSLQ
jgi:hypothetical protein